MRSHSIEQASLNLNNSDLFRNDLSYNSVSSRGNASLHCNEESNSLLGLNIKSEKNLKIFKKMSSFSDRVLFFQKRNKNIEIGTWSEYGENEPESISSYDYMCVRKDNTNEKSYLQ